MTLLDNLDRCLLCNHMRTDQDGEGPVPRDLPAPLLVLTLGRIRLLRQLFEECKEFFRLADEKAIGS